MLKYMDVNVRWMGLCLHTLAQYITYLDKKKADQTLTSPKKTKTYGKSSLEI